MTDKKGQKKEEMADITFFHPDLLEIPAEGAAPAADTAATTGTDAATPTTEAPTQTPAQ